MATNVSLKLLKAFLTLCEQRNFTRAAEHCHVSQSAFSGMIQRLEEGVGTRLFDRDTRNVVLTPEGELFAEASRHLVHDIEWTFSNLDDYVARKKGQVRIGVLPSIAGDWLPPVIAEYRQTYPAIHIEIHDVLSDECLAMLKSGQVDIALAAPNEPPDEYVCEEFCTDSFYLICKRNHPLANLPSVSVEHLRGYDFIHLSRAASIHQFVARAIGTDDANIFSLEVRNLATMSGLILNGLGISLLPELTLYQFKHPDLVAIPLSPVSISRKIYLIRLKERPLSIAAKTMMELIQARRPTAATPTQGFDE